MSRLLAAPLISLGLLAAAPALASGPGIDLPRLWFPSDDAKPVTTRDCQATSITGACVSPVGK